MIAPVRPILLTRILRDPIYRNYNIVALGVASLKAAVIDVSADTASDLDVELARLVPCATLQANITACYSQLYSTSRAAPQPSPEAECGSMWMCTPSADLETPSAAQGPGSKRRLSLDTRRSAESDVTGGADLQLRRPAKRAASHLGRLPRFSDSEETVETISVPF